MPLEAMRDPTPPRDFPRHKQERTLRYLPLLTTSKAPTELHSCWGDDLRAFIAKVGTRGAKHSLKTPTPHPFRMIPKAATVLSSPRRC